MQYLCVHCDETFDPPAGEKPRCPKCMRTHGVRAVAGGAASVNAGAPAKRTRRIAMLAAPLVLAAIAFGYFAWRKSGDAAGAAHGALDTDDVAHALQKRHVEAGELVGLLRPDAAIASFAERAASGKTSDVDRARAITTALRARFDKQGFVPWSLSDARETPLKLATAVLRAISLDGARAQLYPLEVAALGVAALRSLDVPAMLCEKYTVTGERAPLDPSGRLGYFEIALPKTKAGEDRFFDVYGGRPAHAACDCTIVGDVEAVGAALSLRALQRLAHNEDPAAALRDADAAIALYPRSATVRGARGAVLLANAASEPGQRELEAAAQMRPDGPRRNNLAMLHVTMGDGERAAREVSQALASQPDFALARITLAAVHLGQGERELAALELQRAEALDPELPALALTRAQYHASAGETDLAIVHAQRAVKMRPSDPQAHLLLGRIYRQASRFDEMRDEARVALALTPPALTARMREWIERVLGPTALQDNPTPASAPAGAPNVAGEPTRLRLSGELSPGDGALNPAAAPSKLQLQQPGGKLKLDLGH